MHFFWKVDVSDLAEDHLGLRRGSWKDPLNGVDLLGNDVEGFAYTYGDHIESRILVQQATDCFAFPCNQKSQIGLRDNHQYTSLKWKYNTQYEAENALLYHVLLNTRPRRGIHWARKCLLTKKEFLVMIPEQHEILKI